MSEPLISIEANSKEETNTQHVYIEFNPRKEKLC